MDSEHILWFAKVIRGFTTSKQHSSTGKRLTYSYCSGLFAFYQLIAGEMAVCSHARLSMTMTLAIVVIFVNVFVVTQARDIRAVGSLTLDNDNSDVIDHSDVDVRSKRNAYSLKPSYCGGYTKKWAIGRACYVLKTVKVTVDGRVEHVKRMVPVCDMGYSLFRETFCIRHCGGCFDQTVAIEDKCGPIVSQIVEGKCCDGYHLVGTKCHKD
ncbi:hypothetical protein LSAT2_022815 [Lamellibrachia satsuma]|nr:hypothetical protein LSAT2_022815 [Lamellibrachia satsuma]